jgi:uncharacterized membrane protein required for colicin V production
MNLTDQPAARSFPIPGLDLPWIDQVGILLVIAFLVLGIWRGLWWQVVRLAGVVAAVAVARAFTPRFVDPIRESFPELSDSVAHGTVWFVLFLGGLVAASVLGLIGKRALETMQLGLVDRLGGGLAGALTGAILHAAALVVLTALAAPDWSQRALQGTRSAFFLGALSQKAHLLVDAHAAERLRPITGQGSGRETAPVESNSGREGGPDGH